MGGAKKYAHAIRGFGISGPWNHNAAGGSAATPQWDTKIRGHWFVPNSGALNSFSAVCWMYGRRLYEAHPDAALGLIQSHVGGTNKLSGPTRVQSTTGRWYPIYRYQRKMEM
jgi:hypothetical protein